MVTAPEDDGKETWTSLRQRTRPERSEKALKANTVWALQSFSTSPNSVKAWGSWEDSSDGAERTTVEI